MAGRSQVLLRPRSRAGFTLIEWLVVLGLVAGLAGIVLHVAAQKMAQRHCKANLLRIYTALEMYEIDHGTLPRLAFYPDDPKQDRDSLLSVLQPYGAEPETYVCPASPPCHRETGLTYLWNVQLNGKKLRTPGPPTWMLVELNALSDQVPPSHRGRYNILYTDGQVRRSRTPPGDLRGP